MTDAQASTGLRRSLRDLPPGAVGVSAIVAWVAVEVAFRWGLGAALADPLGSLTGADMLSVAAGFTLVTVGIAWWGRSHGITNADWDYDRSLRSIAVGFGGAVAWLVAMIAFIVAYAAVAGPPDADLGAVGGSPAATWVLAVMLLVNGILVPITEELAWRGVIQTALMNATGVLIGSGLTAAAFVLKHVVVDGGAGPFRLASLAVLSVVLCGLRVRYGTTSSTVAHVCVNVYATGSVVLAAL